MYVFKRNTSCGTRRRYLRQQQLQSADPIATLGSLQSPESYLIQVESL